MGISEINWVNTRKSSKIICFSELAVYSLNKR